MSSLVPVSPSIANDRIRRRARAYAANPVTASIRDYATLFKFRVTAMIVLTAWCGAYLAGNARGIAAFSWDVIGALAAIALVAAGTAAMNEIIELDSDARMRRTAMRPLVTGRISLSYAFATALLMIAGGIVYLALATNWLTAILTALTSALYLGVYTPLKKVTPLCTTIGAVPGAMPALLGWTAVAGHLELQSLALFAIMFFWQFPHFHAIAILYREDYERANIRMLPVVEPDGHSTVYSILIYSFMLVPVSLLPALLLPKGLSYMTAAFVLGLGLLWLAFSLWRDHTFGRAQSAKQRARQLLVGSVLYIPALFAAMLLSTAL